MADYRWKASAPAAAKKRAIDEGMSPSNVVFGTDCWAQANDKSDRENENTRLTFGEGHIPGVGEGYGGTASGLGVQPLPKQDLSSGIFANGWAYEHFIGGRDVDRFMWEGKPDLDGIMGLHCDCYFDYHRHNKPGLKDTPLVKYATHYPAGSEGFFHTDYKEPITYLGSGKFYAHLGQQSILPPPGERSALLEITPKGSASGTLEAHINTSPSRCTIDAVLKSSASIGAGDKLECRLTLHKINARGDLSPDITISYRRLPASSGLTLRLFAEVGGKVAEKELPATLNHYESLTLSIDEKENITAIGIYVHGSASELAKQIAAGIPSLLVDIYNVTLKPHGAEYPSSSITDVKFVDRSSHHRLVWSIPTANRSSDQLPWSPITGPISHFVVTADGHELGISYALEFVIDPRLYRFWTIRQKLSSVAVEIRGYAFDGKMIASLKDKVSLK